MKILEQHQKDRIVRSVEEAVKNAPISPDDFDEWILLCEKIAQMGLKPPDVIAIIKYDRRRENRSLLKRIFSGD